MADDQYTTVTSQSWFSRIGDSIKGIFVGLMLFIAAFPIIIWNENRTIDTAMGLKEGAEAVVTVKSSPIDPGNEGKLIHIIGETVTDSILSDQEFGISANVIRLLRNVEMYQWHEEEKSETKKKLGGGTETVTTYSYERGWSRTLIDSSGFHKSNEYQNPASMEFESQSYTADKVMAGDFILPNAMTRSLGNFQALSLPNDLLKTLNETTKEENDVADSKEEEEEGKEPSGRFTVQGNRIYTGDPAKPKVGDLRIDFSVVKQGWVSIVAKQLKNTLEPYHTQAGTTISMIQPGVLSSANMIKQAEESNTVAAWIFRFMGFLFMLIGLSLVLRPLSVLGDVVPFIGDIVEVGTGFVAGIIALSLWVITIALAWIAVRPVLGGGLLVIGIAGFVALKVLSKGKGKAAAEAAPSVQAGD